MSEKGWKTDIWLFCCQEIENVSYKCLLFCSFAVFFLLFSWQPTIGSMLYLFDVLVLPLFGSVSLWLDSSHITDFA